MPDIGKRSSDRYKDGEKNTGAQKKKASIIPKLVQAEDYDEII
jgi:hypothetical protein